VTHGCQEVRVTRTVIRDRAVQVRVARRERAAWRAAAMAAGLTLSELVRECVRARLVGSGAAEETEGADAVQQRDVHSAE